MISHQGVEVVTYHRMMSFSSYLQITKHLKVIISLPNSPLCTFCDINYEYFNESSV